MATDKYKVISPWVGSPHKEGAIITEKEAGAHIGNLIFIGAIEPVTDEKKAAGTASPKPKTARGKGGRFTKKAATGTAPARTPASDNGGESSQSEGEK